MNVNSCYYNNAKNSSIKYTGFLNNINLLKKILLEQYFYQSVK